MRATRILALAMVASLLAAPASAVTIDWVTVGAPMNPADTEVMTDGTTGYGSVAEVYRISKSEVTNAQYAEFLNAVDPTGSNALALYSTRMGTDGTYGGITNIGSVGSVYQAKAGSADQPVNYVSFWDALRFANWLNNGQGNADTETGAYTITAAGISANSITRNPGATIFLTSEDEWYKAAYYNALSTTYFDYPAGSDALPTCASPTATANTANCGNVVGALTSVGAYTGSASPNGTFDQGGNIWEWNESIMHSLGITRGIRGGSTYSGTVPDTLGAAFRTSGLPTDEGSQVGFRVAALPEPTLALLLACGLVGLGMRRRRH